MPTPIKPKRSYTATSVPSGLSAGELAVNAADGKVWIGSSDGKSNVLISSLSLSDMAGTTSNVTEGSNLYYTDSRARLSLSAGTGISYDNKTGAITNSSPDQTVVLTAGTGISTSGTYPNFTITNSSPDQTVKLTSGTGISITGTYPEFTITNSSPSSGGTVTSVGLSLPAIFSISNSPVTTSGTLTGTLANQNANIVFAGPSTGAAASPTFRSLVAADIPTLNQNTTGTASNVTGTVAITNGGTGQTTANAAFNALAPSQTSNSGKYLTTDGTNTSWGSVSSGTTIPSGSMQMYAGSVTQSATGGVVTTNAPSGWLLCNGDIVSRTTYSALFTALGTTYGAGDGSTTFALPDMRSRSAIGVGTGTGLSARTLGGTVGEENTSIGSTNLPAHSHTFSPTGTLNTESSHVHSSPNAGSHNHTSNNSLLMYVGSGGGANLNAGTSYQIYNLNATIQNNGDHSHGNTNGNSGHTHTFTPTANQTTGNGPGTGATLTNMQPSIGLNFIIKI